METENNSKSFDEKTLENIKRQYIKNNILLLGIHVLLTIPYMFLSPKHMMVVNFFSILFYVLGFGFLTKGRKYIIFYSHIILAEILAHDIFCVLIFGWDCGFQLWILALVCTYLKDYIRPDKSERERNISAGVIVLTGFLTFTALYLVTKYSYIPMQDIPSENIETALVLLNSFLTFAGMVAFTGIYAREMEHQYSELHQQADYDQLTGLGNRYYINTLLKDNENNPDIVSWHYAAMIDVDHFKTINDTYGHNNGDIVLRGIAEIISENLPVNIKAGRWGGEEFLILSDRHTDYSDFKDLMEDLRKKMDAHVFTLENGIQIHCTISIGTAGYHEGCSVHDIIKSADDKLYEAKKAGRNCVVSE